MSRKRNFLQQSIKLKTSMRLALIIGASSIAGLVVLLLIVFNLSKQEISKAGNTTPMMFLNAEAFQDTSVVMRGSSNRPVIGIVVETRGNGAALKLNTIKLSMNGTSKPIAKNIENIRLWYTGNDAHFFSNSQTGTTMSAVPEGEFTIETNKFLFPGKNYFWLTADIKSSASPNASLDAECSSLNVGITDYLPLTSSPFGSKHIRANTAYYSTASSSLMNPDAWNTKRDGTGAQPMTLQDGNACFFIQSGNTLTASEQCALSMISVENGGKLIADFNIHANEITIANGGTFQYNVAANNVSCINKMTVENGGTYVHNSTGIYPATNSVFSEQASAIFNSYDEKTFPQNVKWGNIIIDAQKSVHTNIAGAFSNVQGNFEIKSTAGNALYAEGNSAINIGGNFIFSGGIWEGVRGNNSKLALNIKGNFILKGGFLKDVENSHTANAASILNIGGDVLIASGEMEFNNSKESTSEINLSGKENHQVKWTQNENVNVNLCNVNIKAEKEVFIKGIKLGNISKNCTLTVESNAKLWCNNFAVTGEGKFILQDNATLACGHPKGINSDGSEGNILTAHREYSSGANFVYYTNCTPQQTGLFHTAPADGKVRNLIVRKELPTQQVVLSKNYAVTEQVKIGMGELNKGQYDVSLVAVSEAKK